MKSILPVVFLILFKLILDISYVEFVHPIFADFPLNVTALKVAESYLLTILLGAFIMKWFSEIKHPSSIIIYILILNLILPMLSYYGLTNGYRNYIYMSVLSIFIVMLIVKKTKLIKVFYILEGKYIFAVTSLLMTTFVISNLILNGGLSRINFNILEVYDVRESFVENSGRVMGYLLPWVAYSINGILLSLFLYKKQLVLFFIVLVIQLFIFATTGFKSFLYAPLLIIGIHVLINKLKVKGFFIYMTIGFSLLILYSLTLFMIKDDLVTGSIFIRRNFFAPAHIHTLYYDFFQNHPFVMLSNSIFSSFIDYPYGNLSIVHVLSLNYYGRAFGLNVGYIGNAYMNFGFFGVIIFSVLLGFILKVLDSFCKNLPLSVVIASISIPAMAFVNAGLLTALLTHGFGISLFLLWMLAKPAKVFTDVKI